MARKESQNAQQQFSRDEINRLYETINRGVDTLQRGMETLDITLREFRVESKTEYGRLDKRIRALEDERNLKTGEKIGFFVAIKMMPVLAQVVFWVAVVISGARVISYLSPEEKNEALTHAVEAIERPAP